jgi:hypothetical protein
MPNWFATAQANRLSLEAKRKLSTLSPDEKSEIRSLYGSGITPIELAERFDLDEDFLKRGLYSLLGNVLRQNPQSPKTSDDICLEVALAVEKGMCPSEASILWKTRPSAIYGCLKRMDLEVPPLARILLPFTKKMEIINEFKKDPTNPAKLAQQMGLNPQTFRNVLDAAGGERPEAPDRRHIPTETEWDSIVKSYVAKKSSVHSLAKTFNTTDIRIKEYLIAKGLYRFQNYPLTRVQRDHAVRLLDWGSDNVVEIAKTVGVPWYKIQMLMLELGVDRTPIHEQKGGTQRTQEPRVLTLAEIEAIQEAAKNGTPYNELANTYHVSPGSINSYVNKHQQAKDRLRRLQEERSRQQQNPAA